MINLGSENNLIFLASFKHRDFLSGSSMTPLMVVKIVDAIKPTNLYHRFSIGYFTFAPSFDQNHISNISFFTFLSCSFCTNRGLFGKRENVVDFMCLLMTRGDNQWRKRVVPSYNAAASTVERSKRINTI